MHEICHFVHYYFRIPTEDDRLSPNLGIVLLIHLIASSAKEILEFDLLNVMSEMEIKKFEMAGN